MHLPRFEYLRLPSLEECLEVLAETGEEVGIMTGGTVLLVNMKYGIVSPGKVVNINPSVH